LKTSLGSDEAKEVVASIADQMEELIDELRKSDVMKRVGDVAKSVGDLLGTLGKKVGRALLNFRELLLCEQT